MTVPPGPNITMVFSSRWYQSDFEGPPMGGCLVAGLPHLCWCSGPGRHPLLLLPQGDAQREARVSLPAKGLGSWSLTCQQSKPPPRPHPLAHLCSSKLHASWALHLTAYRAIPVQAPLYLQQPAKNILCPFHSSGGQGPEKGVTHPRSAGQRGQHGNENPSLSEPVPLTLTTTLTASLVT